MKRGIVVMLALQLGGCSWSARLVTTSPDRAPRTEELNCGARLAPPVVDTLLAVAGIVVMVVAVRYDSQHDSCSEAGCLPASLIGIPAGGLGVAYLVSAMSGYNNADRCYQHNRIARGELSAIPAPTRSPVQKRRELASRITQLAAAKARAGDCNAVKAFERQIRDLDVDDAVFAQDTAISECLRQNLGTPDAGANGEVVPIPELEGEAPKP